MPKSSTTSWFSISEEILYKMTKVRLHPRNLFRMCEMQRFWQGYEKNDLTVPLMYVRQTGQSLSLGVQSWHATKCPHGRNTVLILLSMQSLHVHASISWRFSANNCRSSSANTFNMSTCGFIFVRDVVYIWSVWQSPIINGDKLHASLILTAVSIALLPKHTRIDWCMDGLSETATFHGLVLREAVGFVCKFTETRTSEIPNEPPCTFHNTN